jgi:hypothetical protein
MSTFPAVMADEINGLNKHIQQLEKLNATLAAQIDRQAKVVDAAIDMEEHGCGQCQAQLELAVAAYRRAMAQLAKDGS